MKKKRKSKGYLILNYNEKVFENLIDGQYWIKPVGVVKDIPKELSQWGNNLILCLKYKNVEDKLNELGVITEGLKREELIYPCNGDTIYTVRAKKGLSLVTLRDGEPLDDDTVLEIHKYLSFSDKDAYTYLRAKYEIEG